MVELPHTLICDAFVGAT